MEQITITKEQARRFILAHQGLWPPRHLKGKNGVMEYIRRVGCIQFDPLNIVGRSPELVLQSRVLDFQPAMLEELLYQDRALLDGWDKQMAIYPVEDWPYFRRDREAAQRKLGAKSRPITPFLPAIRKAMEERGPLSSLDLDFNQSVDWPWAPTRLSRAALESMYFWGELVIHHKVHTRKVYDFAYRHLPADLLAAPDPNATEAGYRDWRVLRRIAGVGMLWNKSGDAWLAIPGVKSKEREDSMARLLKAGKITEVQVEGIGPTLYFRTEEKPLLHQVLDSEPAAQAAILAPLDNLLWDRRLVQALFDFEYRWEVYKPEAERKYGYYVLPVLYGDRFIARFEPERDKDRTLIIRRWWWEPGLRRTKRMATELAECFRRFLIYLGTAGLRLEDEAAGQEGLDWLRDLTG